MKPWSSRTCGSWIGFQTDTGGELTLTLPPLGVGVHHAVVSLTGSDALTADDRRALTVVVPPASQLTIVGGVSEEREILAAAITAPAPMDANAAAYRIRRVSWEDWLASGDDLTTTVAIDPPTGNPAVDQRLALVAAAGKGLLTTLGPAATASPVGSKWCPPRRRVWRVSGPGSFLTDVRGDAALLGDVTSLRPAPPWSDYRVQKYWLLSPESGEGNWRSAARWNGEAHPAIVTRSTAGGAASDCRFNAVASFGGQTPTVGTTCLAPTLGPPSC